MNKRRENESQLRLAGIVESAMDAIITIDGRHRIVLFNPAAEAMFGVSAAEALGQPLSRFVPPKYRDRHDDFIQRFREAGATTRRMGALGAVSALRADGEEFPAEASISHVKVGGEHLATVILRDITERKLNEEARVLLAREVDHRAKNALAVAQSLVTLTQADTKEAYAEAVRGRLAALARAHALLSEGAWQGADLERTVRDELETYARPSQMRIAGPGVTLLANAVQPVSLVLHELATNAVKHGALQAADGHVDVTWSIANDQRLRMAWSESGGPAVQPPARTGFGSRLLSDVVTRQLEGDLELDWSRGGLRATIKLGAGMFRAETRPAASDEAPAAAAAGHALEAPEGRSVLVVEDESLIAMELATELHRGGWSVVGPALSLREGLALVQSTSGLAAAVLDVNLAGRAVYPLAAELQNAGVPFVFCTGYEMVDPEGRFQDAPVLRKPVNMSLLDGELRRLIAA